MLKNLRILNFAIIDEANIEFGTGLNIISGETGAGKSILMDALVLILGGRASSDLIRAKAEEATVEALFEIAGDEEIRGALEACGLSPDDELIVRRIVHRSGKNRIFVNGSMVNMATLQTITASLVDLCSQHDQQLLARSEEQLLWIDRFGSLEADRAKVRQLYSIWKEKQRALDSLSTDSSQREQKIDFLQFQIQELEDASLSAADEDVSLEQELKTLANAENLFAFAAEGESLIYGSDSDEGTPVLDGVVALLNKARALSAADPKLQGALESLNTLKVHAEELGYFLRTYSQGLSRDEGRLEEIHSRLALLAKLKKKYGPSLADAIENLEKFQKELSTLKNHDSSLLEAQAAVTSALENFRREADVLSRQRATAGKAFAKAVVSELSDLHMERARFLVSFQALESPTATGLDSVRFDIAANPGEPMGPLTKVASGGELSRIMLAMHNVVSSRGNVGVYLFDEVDSGIGGKTAVAVGAKLQKVARNNQVICITHLPQVAAYADVHFHVEKSIRKKEGAERTVAQVVHLDKAERELELARMLGGASNDKAALANARAMLEKAEACRPQKTKTAPVAKVKTAAAEKRA